MERGSPGFPGIFILFCAGQLFRLKDTSSNLSNKNKYYQDIRIPGFNSPNMSEVAQKYDFFATYWL